MKLVLHNDRVVLLNPQEVAGSSELYGSPIIVPAKAVGKVIKAPYQEGTALVEWQGKHPPIGVNLQDLKHASPVDLFPENFRRVRDWLSHRITTGIKIAATALIAAGVGAVVTIEVQRFLGKCP